MVVNDSSDKNIVYIFANIYKQWKLRWNTSKNNGQQCSNQNSR